MLVKGITANDVDNTPGVRDDDVPAESRRPADHAEGRRLGLRPAEVQPRGDRRVPDRHQHVRHHAGPLGRHAGAGDLALGHQQLRRQRLRLLPRRQVQRARTRSPTACCRIQNQQIGGALGGPIVKDKMHYFASYEYEREPGTIFTAPSPLPGQSFTHSIQERARRASSAASTDQMTPNDRFTVRGSRWDWDNPFVLAAGGHPSNASVADQERDQRRRHLVEGAERRDTVQEVQAAATTTSTGPTAPQPLVRTRRSTTFPGLTIGSAVQLPAGVLPGQLQRPLRPELAQGQARHRRSAASSSTCTTPAPGTSSARPHTSSTSIPADLDARVPPTRRRSDALEHRRRSTSTVQRVRSELPRRRLDASTSRVRPGRCGSATTGASATTLTVNYGVRWDADWGVRVAARRRSRNSIPISNNPPADIVGMPAPTSATRTTCATSSNVAPRGGFTWNVGGNNDLVDPRRQRALLQHRRSRT